MGAVAPSDCADPLRIGDTFRDRIPSAVVNVGDDLSPILEYALSFPRAAVTRGAAVLAEQHSVTARSEILSQKVVAPVLARLSGTAAGKYHRGTRTVAARTRQS